MKSAINAVSSKHNLEASVVLPVLDTEAGVGLEVVYRVGVETLISIYPVLVNLGVVFI